MEKLRDEGVQLKVLQTALTLMQSPALAEDEVRAQRFCNMLKRMLGNQCCINWL